MFGVQFCAEAQVPDLSSLRLQQVPVFPSIAQTEARVWIAPATDNPTSIQWNNSIKKAEKGKRKLLQDTNKSRGNFRDGFLKSQDFSDQASQITFKLR